MSTVEEKIETVKSRFIFGNLFALLCIVLGSVSCWIVDPLLGWFFLVFSLISVFVILRRLMCNSCYYCKSCTKGLAKLSILFLGANRIPGLSNSSVLGMTVFVYIALFIIPIFVLINSLFGELTTLKLTLLIIILGVFAVAVGERFSNRNKALWKPTVSR
jgi:hypothetical protein